MSAAPILPEADETPADAGGAAPGHRDPDLARFIEQAGRRFRPEQAESFWSLEEDFRALAGSGFAARVINEELGRVAGNPSHMGDWRPNQLVLHRGRDFSILIWLIEENRRYIHSSASLAMCAPLGHDSLRCDIYRLPEDYRNAVFDPSIRLEPAGSGVTAPGGVLLQRAERFVYDFVVERPVAVLKFASAAFQTMEWLFNKDNLHAWQANDSELPWTQLRVAAYILGRLADRSSLEPLQELAAHPHHAVRWAAIQNLGRLSRRAVLPVLEQAVNDPHPHVRRAAIKTLQQLTTKK